MEDKRTESAKKVIDTIYRNLNPINDIKNDSGVIVHLEEMKYLIEISMDLLKDINNK